MTADASSAPAGAAAGVPAAGAAVVPLRRFVGRVAVVTGAGSGIGRATARRLAAEGARVACLDVDLDTAVATAEGIVGGGGEARAWHCDVADPDSVEATAAAVQADLGDVHVLCNVAGVLAVERLERMPVEQWRRVLSVNLDGPFLMCRAFLPSLLRTGGVIVNTGSRSGFHGRAYQTAYCASKAGVHLLTKALALELSDRGVRVNAVVPGGTRTGMSTVYAAPADANPDLLAGLNSPLGIAEPEELAAAIAFVASDEMRFMTGSIVPVDGGISA